MSRIGKPALGSFVVLPMLVMGMARADVVSALKGCTHSEDAAGTAFTKIMCCDDWNLVQYC
jgi:hypothetical protein